jgi:Lrp/AsnC family transcriptional regulator, leucine-responsive regulatory protein
MAQTEWIDQIDLAILELLKQDARRTVTDIASRVNLSLAPVKRRIDRLERTGVIRGFTVILDPSKVKTGVDAYSEIRLSPGDIDDFLDFAQSLPEVSEASSLAGDTDILLRLRVDDVEHLHRLVNELRNSPRVRGIRTLITLKTWLRSDSDGVLEAHEPTRDEALP